MRRGSLYLVAYIRKQSEVLRDAISSLVIENVKQTTLAQQLDKELERLAKKRKVLTSKADSFRSG